MGIKVGCACLEIHVRAFNSRLASVADRVEMCEWILMGPDGTEWGRDRDEASVEFPGQLGVLWV